MLLAIDVGNTNIRIGVFNDDDLIGSWKIMTNTTKTSDEFGLFITSALMHQNVEKSCISDVIISSVVSSLIHVLKNSIIRYFNVIPLIVGPGVNTGITVNDQNLVEIGYDQICDIAACYNLYGGPAIVINFGTVTTYNFVTDKGFLDFSVTSPGIRICSDALWKKSVQLPDFQIKKSTRNLDKNHIISMQEEISYGYIGQVQYIIDKIIEETGLNNVKIVVTGICAKFIVSEIKHIDFYDTKLTLKGLRIIFEINSSGKSTSMPL
ncbi:type III pantothenate kinase [Alkalibaculum sp. M08DMB]|uniref:Type III pantothenate kinase n=1 Tax=Alkalibaculum sporogenes TaxID=2655001 RepID=A0A6A7KAV7_9FIRM|nr:type III pantothenate kinase [Alkalibaculum sporogenes]